MFKRSTRQDHCKYLSCFTSLHPIAIQYTHYPLPQCLQSMHNSDKVSPIQHRPYLSTYRLYSPSLQVSPAHSAHHVLHLCTEPNAVLEHASQGDSVGEPQSHQPHIERGGKRHRRERNCRQKQPAEEVNSHSKPPVGYQVQVPALGVSILVPVKSYVEIDGKGG